MAESQPIETVEQLLSITVCRGNCLREVKEKWPNKNEVCYLLTEYLDTLTRGTPSMARSALFHFLVNFGAKIERADTPEACVTEFIELLRHFACPEPGWEGVDLVITD